MTKTSSMRVYPAFFLGRTALRLVPVAFALLAGGCMVGPDYHRPQVAMPAQWKELSDWTQAEPAAEAPKGDWWSVFHDPLLDELEPLIVVSNQTVRQSYANYQKALAEMRSTSAELFPTLDLSGGTTKTDQRWDLSLKRNGQYKIKGRDNSAAQTLGINIDWAPDLWGQVRRQIEQQSAAAQADQAMLVNATLSAQIALANAVINLRVTDAHIDLLTQTVDAYKDFLRVVSDQDQAGMTPPSDLVLARTQLESAQANLIGLGAARAQYEHAIAVLVGRNPEDLSIAHSARLPVLPKIPAGVPSTILQRRPDIAAAERQMAAANAAIGAATAAYFPSISLSSALTGMQQPVLSILRVSNYTWALGAGAAATLFDGGVRSARVDAARANYDATVANYRGTVLRAFQNVEDNLSSLHVLAQQAEALDGAVRHATHGTQIAHDQYEAGTIDYTTVATAQVTQFNNQRSALDVLQQRLLNTVALIGNLGGSWADTPHDASPQPDPERQRE
ncbi:MAG: efflux transporter outer membrane subunit [Burkholderiaceae bacterium]|jgi:NodT family efflux transporter outer membrane factor (OMF) lipoprotein|nr:efflux transporter outer membrane subunit [Burkholderiaceae bacterium]